MDAKSLRVAEEIVEAGVLMTSADVEIASFEELNGTFVALGNWLAEAEIGSFTRDLPSVQSEEQGAAELRERIAVDLHRACVPMVSLGVRAAALAWKLSGRSSGQASLDAATGLRSMVSDDSVPGDSTADLLATAHRNYVLAAGDLHRAEIGAEIGERDGESEALESFALGILGNVTAFAVIAAAMARAIEEPAIS